ncbi:MAG TPA: SDR family oxidoreductase [Streptosporangiaceae bacterium]|nr:SDR family oxidoreductase [Streptosporangiaceae bacterium]
MSEPQTAGGAAPVTGVPMGGRVCVVTGASSGIGQAASVALAGLGATVVLVCRDRGRGQNAMAEVGAAARGGEPSLELADLSSAEQVRDLAGRLAGLPRIDVLVNNAGLVIYHRQLTADGLEHTFALNHLAPFLLTNLLRPKLEASGPARVVTVASTAHRGARLDLDDLQLEHRYSAMLAYSNSKLANILFTRELARRLDGTGVTANCLHPGTVRTRFGQTGSAWLRLGIAIAAPFFRSPEQGARTLVYLASSPEVSGQSGGYYVSGKLREPSPTARNDDTARRLWDLSAELTGLS